MIMIYKLIDHKDKIVIKLIHRNLKINEKYKIMTKYKHNRRNFEKTKRLIN